MGVAGASLLATVNTIGLVHVLKQGLNMITQPAAPLPVRGFAWNDREIVHAKLKRVHNQLHFQVGYTDLGFCFELCVPWI